MLSAGSAGAGNLITRTITLGWDPSPDANVAGYRVHYGTQRGQYPNVIDVGNKTVLDILNLVDGTTYYFTITAYSAAGSESAPSDELTHTVNPGMLLNMSTRASVGEGDNVLIAGFIIGGSSRKTVIIRALGPSLGAAGVANALADPALEVYGSGGLIALNDNWRSGSEQSLTALNFAPAREEEAGLVLTLAPGTYSAIVRGVGSSGVALLEIYDAGIPTALGGLTATNP